MIGIKEKEKATQQVGNVPNLGGPTSTYLDDTEIQINLLWAQEFERLNQGAGP